MSASDGSTAANILTSALGHMRDRAATYDKPEGERSMGATVDAFHAVTGVSMTEEQGWLFMALLKAVRSQQGAYRADSYEDGAAYFALAGEAAVRDRTVKESLTVHQAGVLTYNFDKMTPPPSFGQQNMIDPEDVEISEKQACSVSADEHADMLARFDKRRAELLCRGSCESNVTVLPDGSAFGVMSFPLSRGHWLYADRAHEDGADQPKELPAPILNHGSRDTVVAAARYAVRGATNCGKEPDFDPDALVQNVVYALCGPYGRAEPIPVDPADVDIASAIDDDSERMQAIGQNGEMASEVYAAVDGAPSWRDAPSWAQWLAQDSGGRWYWFECPIYADSDDEEWYEQEGFNGGVGRAGESEERNENWSKTMQARPIK